MSTSSNEGVKSEKAAAPLEDEEETETNNNVTSDEVDERNKGEVIMPSSEKSKLLDCCKYYNKLLSTTPGAKVSDRDALITTLQNQLKNMENQYKKALDEQQDIKRKYAETVQRLSKAEEPQVELTENKNVEATDESIHLDNLRMEMSNRLETTKMKPKKCCRYLYEALGVDIPEKKLNKKVAKSEKKSSNESGASKNNYVDSKAGARKGSKDLIEECKKICSDLNRTGRNEKVSVELLPKIKEQKSLECRETCKTVPFQFDAQEGNQKYGLQKELSTQVAMMEVQEKDLNDLQDKLKKLCDSLECFERSRTSANKPHSTTVGSPMRNGSHIKTDEKDNAVKKISYEKHASPQDIPCYERCMEEFKLSKRPPETNSDLKISESAEKAGMKPDKKEPKRRLSRCCKRATSQESRKKVKPQQKEVDSSVPKDLKLEDGKCCNFDECTTSKTNAPSKTSAEQTKSTALHFSPPEESNSKDKKEDAPKIIEERPSEKFPCYDKCVGDKSNSDGKVTLHAPPEKETETETKKSGKEAKSTTVDEGDLKHSSPESDKKEKRKSRCCPRKKSKSNLADKSEEACDCGAGNCPVKKEAKKVDQKSSSSEGKRDESEGADKDESTCCDFNDCPSNKEFPWGVTKSQEITCCDLEDCPKAYKQDAYTSTCDEKCPKSRTKPEARDKSKESPPESPKKTKTKEDAKKKELNDAYQKALKDNKDLEMQIESQKLLAAQKEEEIEDLQNQLNEIILKNKTLLCTFGCQLDELRAGYESAQKEMSRIKENREALNHNVEKLKAEYDLALQEKHELAAQKENEANELRGKLHQATLDSSKKESEAQEQSQNLKGDDQNENEQSKETAKEMSELQKKADSDCRALRICESKYNELKSEYEYFKEKVTVSENQCVLLRQEIVDLKDALGKANQENTEIQSCKLECDKMKDKCFQECKQLKEESKKKETQLEDVLLEKDNLVRENSEQISGLENKILNLSNDGLAMQEANARLSEELAEARDGMRNLRHSVGGLAEDKSTLEDELAEKQKEIRQLEEALERKSQDLDEVNDERLKAENMYKIQMCNLECTLEEQRCCFEDATNKLRTAKDANNRLSQDLERLGDQHISLNGDLETWKRKYEDDVGDLRKDLAEAREELVRAEAKLKENEEQLKHTISDYESKFFELINKYDISQRELQDHQEDQEMLEGKLAASLNQLEKVKHEAAERTNEYQQEKGEKEKLRRELDRSTNDFHDKQRSLEETHEALEQARQDKIDVENDLKITICSYECKINELGVAQESTANELLSLKEEMNQVTQENQKLKTHLTEKDSASDEMKNTIAVLTKELEDLRAVKTDGDKNNASYVSKIEKLTADYEEAQAEIQRLKKTLSEMKNAKPEHSIGSLEKKKENEVEKEGEFKAKCISECKKRCAVKTDMRTLRAKREECRKSCGALKKSGESQDQIKRPQVDPEKAAHEKKLLCKTDQPLNKECRDLCAELNSIKKMLSDIEIVSTPKPTMVMEASGSQLISPPKVNGQNIAIRKSNSWKEEYEKTAQERDELKQEISQMYNKLKEVMKELENKLNV